MPRILAGGRRDAKLGTTPSGKVVWLEKLPGDYKGWSASDHLYAAVLHDANRTRGGVVAEAHRALARGGAQGRPLKKPKKIYRQPNLGIYLVKIDGVETPLTYSQKKQGQHVYVTPDDVEHAFDLPLGTPPSYRGPALPFFNNGHEYQVLKRITHW